MSDMYCGGHGLPLPCSECAANLKRRHEKDALLQPKAGEPTAESVLRELVRRHDTSTVEALYPELLAIWEAARKVLAAPPVGMVSEPTADLLTAALLMLERPDWSRVEMANGHRITREELCQRIRDFAAAPDLDSSEPYLCINPACLPNCSDCNCAISPQQAREYAVKYAEILAGKALSVPLEPTEWMLIRANDAHDDGLDFKGIYQAMLEARPGEGP